MIRNMNWTVYDESKPQKPILLTFPTYVEASWVCMHNLRKCTTANGTVLSFMECADCNKRALRRRSDSI